MQRNFSEIIYTKLILRLLCFIIYRFKFATFLNNILDEHVQGGGWLSEQHVFSFEILILLLTDETRVFP